MRKIFLFILAICLTNGLLAQSVKDETAFLTAFRSFRSAITHHDLVKAGRLLQFPFFTAKEDKDDGSELPVDAIEKSEYDTYKNDIFNEEVRRIFPELGERGWGEFNGTVDSYYNALRKITDRGSKMYEVYAQYPVRKGITESYFGFIFGRVKGNYKVIAYYAKWPVR